MGELSHTGRAGLTPLVDLSRKSPDAPKKRTKQATKWDLGGTSRDRQTLDYSASQGDGGAVNGKSDEVTELEVSVRPRHLRDSSF